MWKRIVPFLIILSISLNAAFIGIWVAREARGHRIDPERNGQPCGGVSCPLHRSLDVTDEQWSRLEPRLARFRCDSQSLCRDIHRMQGELIDLLASPHADGEAIAAKQDEILDGQRKMQQLVIAHLLAEKEMLTEEQQAKLFDMIRERSGCAGGNAVMCPVSVTGARSGSSAESEE